MFLLAKSYSQAGENSLKYAMNIYQEEYDEFLNTKGCEIDKKWPVYKESAQWKNKSTHLYQKIVQDHPHCKDIDEILFEARHYKKWGRIEKL